jgi:hypothetical protein
VEKKDIFLGLAIVIAKVFAVEKCLEILLQPVK